MPHEQPIISEDPRAFIRQLRLEGSSSKHGAHQGIRGFGAVEIIASMPRSISNFLRDGKPYDISEQYWENLTARWEEELALPDEVENQLAEQEHEEIEDWFAQYIAKTGQSLHDEHDHDYQAHSTM